MKLNSAMVRNSLFFLAVMLAWPGIRAVGQSKSEASQSQAKQSNSQAVSKPMPLDKEALEAIQEGPDFLKRRQDWFFKPRAFPLGFIPQGARERALQQKMQMYQREGRLNLEVAPGVTGFVAPASGTSSNWFSIGPQPTSSLFNPPFTSGRVTALAMNPNNANNVYLGGADGGLWVTTDGGNTWTPLTDNPPNAVNIPTVAVGAIAVDPITCSAGICTTVYVGTGEDNFAGDNIYGEGVLNCTVTAGPPPTASCTQDSTFHLQSPLDQDRGGPMIGALAVNRASGHNNILLAGVRGRGSAIQSGVWCSSDSAKTWTPVLPTMLTNGAGDPGTDVAFGSDGTAWVALGFPRASTGNGIYKSAAPVASCTITFNAQMLPSAFTANNIGKITLALAPSSKDTIYAAIADGTTGTDSDTLLGVVRSTNATTAAPMWTQLTGTLVSTTMGFCNSQCSYDMSLAVDPVNPAVVYGGGAGTNPIIRTTNGTTTATFTDVTGAGGAIPHVDTHAFAFAGDGSKLWVGNDGGVWSTLNPATTVSWSNLNGPSSGSSTGALNLTQFYPGVSIHPANPGFAMGGTQDNGTQIDQAGTTPASPLIWRDAGLPCDGGFTVIDPNIPSTSYGECEYVPSSILFIGVTFLGNGLLGNGFMATSGINGADRGSFIPPLVVDEKNSQTLYFGTCRVWQTKNGASTWSAISPDVTTSTHPATCPVPTMTTQPSASISTIAVAPSDSNTIYAGSDEGEVEVTSNGGSMWTSLVPTTTQTLPTRAVTQIVVDPSNNNIAYVAFSGFGSCAVGCTGPTGHVFKTLNGTAGAATMWTDIDGAGLPDIPVNAIVLDPADATHNTLYVGTDIGAFFTTTAGASWSPLGASGSMPNAQILSLTLHNPSRTLRAATHGRGVWDLDLGGQAAFGITSISPFSANAGSASITNFTVNGNGFMASSVVNLTANGATTPLTTSCATATTCTATIPSAQLANGALAQVTVTNSGTMSNAMPFTVLSPAPAIVSISPTTVPAGSSAVLTVNGGSPSNFLCGTNGTLVLFNLVALPPSAITGCNPSAGTLTVQVPAANLATPGSVTVDTFNPPPGGGFDTNATPPVLTITPASGTFSVSGSPATITTAPAASGMATGTSTITVGGATAATTITCGSLPGVTCNALSIPQGTTSGTLTINVLDPSSTMTAMAMPASPNLWAAATPPSTHVSRAGWWTLSGGTGFAAILLLFLPGRKRYRAALGFGLVCLMSFGLGCGGYGGGGGGGGGLASTSTSFSVSSTKVTSGTSVAFTVKVSSTGTAPAGMAEILEGTTVVGSAVVSGGQATISTSTLAVGTHTLSASYLGDAYTKPSQTTGSLNITITGTTPLPITGASGGTNANANVSLTIN